MALGGGNFTSRNKVLPGTYINVVSTARSMNLPNSRGTAAMALELDWGIDNEVFELAGVDLQKNSMEILGYDYNSPKLKGLRDLFLNANCAYIYRLNSGGVKAENTYSIARHSGVKGNEIKTTVAMNVEDNDKFDVITVVENLVVDSQTVASAEELIDNAYVKFKATSLSEVVAEPLTGGTNGIVTGGSHQLALDKFEAFSFNALGVITTDDIIKSLYVAYTKRMRDEVGAKFQTVIYNKRANYEGVVNVGNKVLDEAEHEASLVYFVTGAIAGRGINESNTNRIYDGEYLVDTAYTQTALENAIKAGEFVLHSVGLEAAVLKDINSLVTISDTKGDIFKDNKAIRISDMIAVTISQIFNVKYLGKIGNNNTGRLSFWVDLIRILGDIRDMGAIEPFADEDIVVFAGEDKNAVEAEMNITIIGTMEQLYMTVHVS
jgi:Phage tail sheath protein.